MDQLVLLELLLLGLLSMLLGPDLENELLLLNPYPLPMNSAASGAPTIFEGLLR